MTTYEDHVKQVVELLGGHLLRHMSTIVESRNNKNDFLSHTCAHADIIKHIM